MNTTPFAARQGIIAREDRIVRKSQVYEVLLCTAFNYTNR